MGSLKPGLRLHKVCLHGRWISEPHVSMAKTQGLLMRSEITKTEKRKSVEGDAAEQITIVDEFPQSEASTSQSVPPWEMDF